MTDSEDPPSPKKVVNHYLEIPEDNSDRTHSGSIPHLSIGYNSTHTVEKLPQVEVVEEFIHDDAEKLREHFKSAYNKVCGDMDRPYVLIAGRTGAGKSSIINSIFGSDIAAEGAGRPITQNFTKYCPDTQPIVLYDSKGLEVGMQFDEFKQSTLEFFAKNEDDVHETHLNNNYEGGAEGLEKKVHLVWYVINAASGRVEDFEEKVCRELFGRLPIIFLLNKADIATEEQKASLRDVVNEMELPNCLGVFDCVTSKYELEKAPEVCMKCGSPNLLISQRNKVGNCENCGSKTPFVNHIEGLHNVLRITLNTLPNIAKESFVSSQRLSFALKDSRAKKIITDFYEEQSQVFTSQGLVSVLAKMLTRLSIVWQFRDHGHLYATHIAKDIVSSFSVRDKIYLFVHKNKHQKLRATAIGIIWNRCVRELAKIVLVESVESVSEQKIKQDWHKIMGFTFQDLNDHELDIMEERLKEEDLESVLDSECSGPIPGQKPACHTESSLKLLLGEVDAWKGWEGFLSSNSSPITSPSHSPKGKRKTKKHKSKRKHGHRSHKKKE